MQAGLEDMAGNTVNTDKGLWMHHMVGLIKGPEHFDASCGTNASSLPHMALDWEASDSERFISSGNERTPAWFQRANGKWGQHFAKGDEMGFIIDLMNTNMESHDVSLYRLGIAH
jgi:hypothetical protein